MSGTVNYPKVIDQLTDVIKELNVGFAPCGEAAPAAPSEETRQRDAVDLLKALLSGLEQGSASGAAAAAAAAAEHDASADKRTSRQQACVDLITWLKSNSYTRASAGGAANGHFTEAEITFALNEVYGVDIRVRSQL